MVACAVDPILRAAHTSVSRACGFGALAIFCFMAGFSYEPHLAARVGAMFALIMSGVLLVKALAAPKVPYKSTETWIILDDVDRPPANVAQAIISGVLHEVFLIYARYSFVSAAVLFAAGFLLALKPN